MLDHDELLPEEQAHTTLVQELKATYHAQPEEEQMLARARKRLESIAQGPLPLIDHRVQASSRPRLYVVPPVSSAEPTRTGKGRFRLLNTIAAALLVGVLISSLAITLAVIHQNKTASSPVGSTTPARNGTWLTSGLRLKMSTEQTGWAVGDSRHGPFTTVIRTTDGGKHWQNVTPTGVADVAAFYVLDENNAWLPILEKLGQTQVEKLWRTTDGGKTWRSALVPDALSHGELNANMVFIDQNTGWWLIPPEGTPSALNDGTPAPSGKLTAVHPAGSVGSVTSDESTQSALLYHTSDGGQTWQKIGSTLPFFDMQFLDHQRGWATTTMLVDASGTLHSAFFATSDGGRTWTLRSLPVPAEEKRDAQPSSIETLSVTSASVGYLRVSFASSNMSSVRDYVYQTSDAGRTWQVIGPRLPQNVGLRIFLDNHHAIGGTGVTGVGLAGLVLANGHWQQTPFSKPGPGDRADVSFLSPDLGFVLMATPAQSAKELYHALDLYRTDNGGQTWQKLATLPASS